MGLLQRLGLAPDRGGIEALAGEIELLVLRPCAAHEIEPFSGVFVTIVVRAHVGAEHVEFVLEPSAHHVHGETAVGDMIDGGRHLGHHQGMHQRHVDGGEHRAIVGDGADRRRPGEALERAVVEVRRPAVALPAPDRQQRLHAGAIHRLRDSLVSGQLSFQASGTVVMVEPWLQLKAMTPSFMRLQPNSRARAV